MNIRKERTRLIVSEYTPGEKQALANKVASMDNIFMYIDPDKNILGLPTGMEQTLRKMFPNANFEDRSNEFWDYARITPVQHEAKPRNQLQIDFIGFVLEHAKNKEKLAGILGVGTGKALPNSTKLPAPNDDGYIEMGNIKPGDMVYDSNGDPVVVYDVFPQGIRHIYKITFDDNRIAFQNTPNCVYCDLEHLWNVYMVDTKCCTLTTEEILCMHKDIEMYLMAFTDDSMASSSFLKIEDVEYDHDEEATCIAVDSNDHQYVTEGYVITHNTFMACYSAIAVGARTLIIAPTSGIKDQWADTLNGMFKVPADRVLNVNSPKDFFRVKADFVIISQASLQSLNKTYDLERIMKDNKFGIKVIDEVQMWFKNIINVDANCNIANNWYLTGTFGRSSDDENRLYQEMFGDLAIFREEQKKATIFNPKPGNVYGMKPYIHTKMLWTHGGLTQEEIKEVTNSMRYSAREGRWVRYGISMPAYTNKIIPPDGHMTKYLTNLLEIIRIADRQVKYGRMLVLVGTIAATEVVAKHVQHLFPNKKIGTFHSENSKELNAQNKADCDILISTTQSAGTGFDMKDLSKLILSASMKSWILATQCAGRLRRRPDGKDCYLWDIVDADIKQLRAWANVRADTIRKMSKTFKVEDFDVEFREFYQNDELDLLDSFVEETSVDESGYVPVYGVAGSFTTDTDTRNDGTPKNDKEKGYATSKKVFRVISGGDTFSHVALSFDPDLSTMYSYDASGFYIDSIKDGLWNTCDHLYTCVIFIPKKDANNIKAKINDFISHRLDSRYAMGNIVRLLLSKPRKFDYRYICSSFVGYMLNIADPKFDVKDWNRMRPEDITLLPRAYILGLYKDNTEFLSHKDEIPNKVQTIFNEHYEEIDEYNNMLPKVLLQDQLKKASGFDKLIDWVFGYKKNVETNNTATDDHMIHID